MREPSTSVGAAISATAAMLAAALLVAVGSSGPAADALVPAVPRDFAIPMAGSRTLDSLEAMLGRARFLGVLRLNRCDAAHARRLDTLVVPDSASFGRERVFPDRLPAADSLPRILVVAARVQSFAAYDSGRRVRSGPVSTGKASTPTPEGLYWANWKARLHRSSVDSSWIMPWTVNFEAREGIALHQYALPGKPASHCCIRLLEDDARWVFEWVKTRTIGSGTRVRTPGTPIVVLGAYDFESPPPWRRLPGDPDATRLTRAELAALSDQVAAALSPSR